MITLKKDKVKKFLPILWVVIGLILIIVMSLKIAYEQGYVTGGYDLREEQLKETCILDYLNKDYTSSFCIKYIEQLPKWN